MFKKGVKILKQEWGALNSPHRHACSKFTNLANSIILGKLNPATKKSDCTVNISQIIA